MKCSPKIKVKLFVVLPLKLRLSNSARTAFALKLMKGIVVMMGHKITNMVSLGNFIKFGCDDLKSNVGCK